MLALLTLLFPAPALACGPYIPKPAVNVHPVVEVQLGVDTVSTTSVPGLLAWRHDGVVEHLETWMWTIRDIEVVGDQLVIAGSTDGRPTVMLATPDDIEGRTVAVVSHDQSAMTADVVDVMVSTQGDALRLAAIVEGQTWNGDAFTVPAAVTLPSDIGA